MRKGFGVRAAIIIFKKVLHIIIAKTRVYEYNLYVVWQIREENNSAYVFFFSHTTGRDRVENFDENYTNKYNNNLHTKLTIINTNKVTIIQCNAASIGIL